MKLNLRGDTLVAKNPDGEHVFIPALFWSSAHSFLDDWDKPLGALAPGDNSQHGDEIRHRLQTGLRAIVRHSGVMCGLPARNEAGEALVGRLDAILGASGKVGLPAAFYAPVFCLREWLMRRAIELMVVEDKRGMTDNEWAAYVQRIGSGG